MDASRSTALDDNVGWLLAQSARRARRLADAELAPHDASRAEYHMLTVLAEGGSASQVEIGNRMTLDRSDVAALVAALEHGGWITRERSPRDRRRNVVALTESGRERQRMLERAVETANARLLEPLPPADRDTLRALVLVLAYQDSAAEYPQRSASEPSAWSGPRSVSGR